MKFRFVVCISLMLTILSVLSVMADCIESQYEQSLTSPDFENDVIAVCDTDVNQTVKINMWAFAGGQKYFPDSSEPDQGATASGQNDTVYDLISSIGPSKKALIILRHTGSQDTTTYIWDSSEDLSHYPNIYFYIEPGAVLKRTTENVILTLYKPENLIISPRQQIISNDSDYIDMIRFSKPGTVYPEMWGAKTVEPNSTVDSYEPIQYAINSIASVAGTVDLDRGIYETSHLIEISNSGITFQGQNPSWYGETNGTLIRGTTANTDILYVHGSDNNPIKNVTIKNIQVQYGTGSGGDTNTSGAGVDLRYAYYSRIENVRCLDVAIGIYIAGCIDLTILDPFIQRLWAVPEGTSYGIFFDGESFNASINIMRPVIGFFSGDHVGTAVGIYSSGSIVQDITLDAPEISNADTAIYFNASGDLKYDIKIISPIIDVYRTNGIEFVGFHDTGMATVHGGWFASSTYSEGTCAAIKLNNADGVNIENNQFYGGSTNASVSGNYGVLVVNGSTGITISNNKFRNFYNGIGVASGNYLNINGNDFYNSNSYSSASIIVLSTASKCNIIGNILNGYAANGILLSVSSSRTITSLNNVAPTIATPISDNGSGNLVANNITM